MSKSRRVDIDLHRKKKKEEKEKSDESKSRKRVDFDIEKKGSSKKKKKQEGKLRFQDEILNEAAAKGDLKEFRDRYSWLKSRGELGEDKEVVENLIRRKKLKERIKKG